VRILLNFRCKSVMISFWTNVAVHHRSARGNAGNHGGRLLNGPQPASSLGGSEDGKIA
jgi:hypothetical protein